MVSAAYLPGPALEQRLELDGLLGTQGHATHIAQKHRNASRSTPQDDRLEIATVPASFDLLVEGAADGERQVEVRARRPVQSALHASMRDEQPASVAVGVGFIALAGVAVEIGVIMLVYLNQALQRHKDAAMQEQRALTTDDVHNAIIDGALLLDVAKSCPSVGEFAEALLPVAAGAPELDGNILQEVRRTLGEGLIQVTPELLERLDALERVAGQ